MSEEKKNPELELEAVDDSDLQDVAGGLLDSNSNNSSDPLVIDLTNGTPQDIKPNTSAFDFQFHSSAR